MPANKYALLRYRIIDRCLINEARPYPSKEDLRLACEEALYGSDGERISISTIEKDMWAMRYESDLGYYAPIAYSSQHRGYFYDEEDYTINDVNLNEEDLSALRLATETLNQFRDSPLFRRYHQAIDKIVNRLRISPDFDGSGESSFIQFEEAPEVKGIEHLSALADAIRNRQVVRFVYEKFSDGSRRAHEVHPYLLKEYRNRWYLITYEPEKDDFRTYGLDRMEQIEVDNATFTPQRDFDSDRFFMHSIGITELDKDPVEVVFRCDATLGKYLASQPLHGSQRIAEQGDGRVEVTLKVLVTYELLSELRGYGPAVEVLAPEDLRIRFKEELQTALSRYK